MKWLRISTFPHYECREKRKGKRAQKKRSAIIRYVDFLSFSLSVTTFYDFRKTFSSFVRISSFLLLSFFGCWFAVGLVSDLYIITTDYNWFFKYMYLVDFQIYCVSKIKKEQVFCIFSGLLIPFNLPLPFALLHNMLWL